jgi:hypothetical protein
VLHPIILSEAEGSLGMWHQDRSQQAEEDLSTAVGMT